VEQTQLVFPSPHGASTARDALRRARAELSQLHTASESASANIGGPVAASALLAAKRSGFGRVAAAAVGVERTSEALDGGGVLWVAG
jgi:hypothetical protein